MQPPRIPLVIEIGQALLSATLVLMLIFTTFFVVEPQVGRAVSSTFSVTQEIGAEISFLVTAANVTMAGPISGLTGGVATGSTQTVVRSNAANGYNMTIAFTDANGDGVIMQGESTGSGAIQNYRATTSEPTYDFFTASSAAVFGYTVTASSSDLVDLDQSFKNNGSNACNSGSNTTANICWMAPSTTAFQIIDRSSSAPYGATTTVRFRVYVPNNPNPSVDTGFYTATATLTAVNNP